MTFGQRSPEDTIGAAQEASANEGSGMIDRAMVSIDRILKNMMSGRDSKIAELASGASGGAAAGTLQPIDVRNVVRSGYLIIFAFFGIFGGWAAYAPLESAAVAPGVVSVETKRKTIQHLEGGIVERIYVQDGIEVEQGQVLVRLDDTQAKANLDLLNGNFMSLSALEARLTAERDGKETIRFSESMMLRADEADISEMLIGQQNIFLTRREAVAAQIAILEQGVAQYQEEVKGLEGQIKSEVQQLKLLDDELAGVQKLLDKGLARRPRLLALQRQKAEVQGQQSQNSARIARVMQSIAETRLRMSEVKVSMANEVVEKLREVQSERVDVAERVRAADDVLLRTTIRAPMNGTVVELKIHTQGGVIAPGAPILDIVPSADQLIVEAQVDPNDIDVVYPGLLARVRLSAFSQRTVRPIEGRVLSVSADRLINQNTGQPYYTAIVELTEDPQKVIGDAPLHPGMSAEVMLVTGSGTALDYMLAPISRTFERALREN
jgi:membrane fusion protein, epimerase transport system